VQIHRRGLEPGRALGAELVEEALEGGAGLALADPDYGAVVVVVGDHRQVAVSLAVRDLIDPDPIEPVQTMIIDVVSNNANNADGDGGHGRPGAAQQPGDGGLVGALGQVGDDVFDVAGEPRRWAGPWHRLGPHPVAAPAGQPADLRLQVQPRGAQVQVAPAAGGPVVDRAGRPAARAAQPLRPPPQQDNDAGRGGLDPDDVGAGMASILLNAVVARTRRSQGLRLLGSSEPYEARRVRVLPSSPLQSGLLTEQANQADAGTIQPTEPRGGPIFGRR
jgi:hypothetical protein